MPFVLNASVTLAWALDDHKTEAAEQALRRQLDDTAVRRRSGGSRCATS